MLPRSQRMSVEQFNAIMEKGRVTHSPLFLLRSLKISPTEHARISAIAPQKIAKKAVLRNKLRRQIYEAVRPLYSKISPGIHTAVFAKSTATTASFNEMASDIKTLFVKAGILK